MPLGHARTPSSARVAVGPGSPGVRRAGFVLLATAGAVAVGGTGEAEATPFADTEGSVYEEAVDALAERDIVFGCREDAFCPNDPVRRDQLASMVARAVEATATTTGTFRDVQDGVHADNVDALAEAAVVRGCEDELYCPSDATQRAQMATMLDRAFDFKSTGADWFADTGSSSHADAIDRLAANGIAAGCARSTTDFCPTDEVNRGQVALFLARSMDLVDRVEPQNLDQRKAAAEPTYDPVWDDLAECESGGNWSINTGNGYYGGLQFSLSSWRGVGGSGYPHEASKLEQIDRGERLQAQQGWGAWPHCSKQVGLR